MESPPYMIERTWSRERPPLLILSSHLNSKDGLCFSDSKYARRNEKSSVENFVASAIAFLNARLLAKFSETVVMMRRVVTTPSGGPRGMPRVKLEISILSRRGSGGHKRMKISSGMVRTVLTSSGCIVYDGPIADIKKELTVRPITDNQDYGGFPAPPFKVFRMAKKTGGICVPKCYARGKFGPPNEDKRIPPKRCPITFTGVLRDATHQNVAVNAAIKASSGLLSLPCGYGKTTCALAIAARLGYRTMIVVHKSFLADQWRERIAQFCPGATIGVVQGPKLDVEADFVIAMLQSLSQKSTRRKTSPPSARVSWTSAITYARDRSVVRYSK